MTTNTINGLAVNAVPRGIELRTDTAIQGLQTALPPSVTQLVVGSVTYTIPNLIAFLQGLEKPWKDARAAHATIRQSVQDRPQDYAALHAALLNLKGSLEGALGYDNQLLVKFGFTPSKTRKPLTSEQKTIRAAKAKLTRQKRGTLGKKQKAGIKQTVAPTVTISPSGQVAISTVVPTAPAAPASSSTTPAPQAPSVTPASPASSSPPASSSATPAP